MFMKPFITDFDMLRNLDLTALRSFVTVAETGGVTRAAGFLHLTQSAVSMQLKRLEESLGVTLLDRSSRSVSMTAAGEQLFSYARRMIDLNDEVISRMTDTAYAGEIILGVPHDIVYPMIPDVLRRFNAAYPRIRLQLLSSNTVELKAGLARGEAAVILTTEDDTEPGGETLAEVPLVWVGAPGGCAWKQRPLRLGFEKECIFRRSVMTALDEAEMPWDMAIEGGQTRTIEAAVAADLAVHCLLAGFVPPHLEIIQHNGALPQLTSKKINLYQTALDRTQPLEDLVAELRGVYGKLANSHHDLSRRAPVAQGLKAVGGLG
jgi:DNA-binding transcriptional LysR family regulator